MIYLRSLIVGVLTCALWFLLLYLTSDGKIVGFVYSEKLATKVLLYATFVSAALAHWLLDTMLPRDPKTGQIVGLSPGSVVARLCIAICTGVGFSIVIAGIDGDPMLMPTVLFSLITFMVMLSAYAACQLLHRLGPTYLLTR